MRLLDCFSILEDEMNRSAISAMLAILRCELTLHFPDCCSDSSLRSSSVRSSFAIAPTWKMHPSSYSVFLSAIARFARRTFVETSTASNKQHVSTIGRQIGESVPILLHFLLYLLTSQSSKKKWEDAYLISKVHCVVESDRKRWKLHHRPNRISRVSTYAVRYIAIRRATFHPPGTYEAITQYGHPSKTSHASHPELLSSRTHQTPRPPKPSTTHHGTPHRLHRHKFPRQDSFFLEAESSRDGFLSLGVRKSLTDQLIRR